MSTRRFSDDIPDPVEPDAAEGGAGTRLPSVRRSEPTSASTPARTQSPANTRTGSAHLPRTLTQVLNEANERLVQGDLVDYVPLPTGFDPLDGFIGGGLRKTELVLLGGAQGIGKTIATLQIARNIALRPDQYVFYLSYEHTETHLMHRLLCLESVSPPEIDLSRGVKLRDLYQIIVTSRAKEFMGRDGGAGSLQAILREDPRTAPSLTRIHRYADRMILVKASPAVTTLRAIKEMTARLCDATGGNVVLFIDYLQKIAVHPERPRDENDKVTIIVEGLKDIAMTLDIPVWSIVAADREGLKSKRIHLFHLRGSSALDYESDIAIIMNNKYQILSKDHVAFNPYTAKQFRDWVVFTIEKNRAGRAMYDMEFQLHGQHFAFDPRGQKVQQQLIDDKIIET
ncbi:MAG: DnaB helicase C-terminal domain-containing protein [Anaerolineae bacterium]|nr:DnaB helicase C-terminal domain-containing protein [Anaerolineae bacterium]NUQ03577.1 AAA family ATPase [Anaerolineae bacterium]